MAKNTGETEWLIRQLTKDWSRQSSPDASKIKLNQLISKLGFVYEKIRNAIDYNEEHLIRRNSLKRLLNRQVKFLTERDPIKISQTIIYEFIRAKYLPNDTLPESDIEAVAIIIAKSLMLIRHVSNYPTREQKKLGEWILDLLVCEIDEYLFPPEREMAMTNFMYGEMIKSINFSKIKIDEAEKGIQIYIAVLKNLNKADQPLIRYLLLKLYYPDWNTLSPDQVKEFAKTMGQAKAKIEAHFSHPYGYQLSLMLRAQAVFFQIMRQTIEGNPETIREIIADDKKLEEKINEVCNKNYKKVRSNLIGSIVRVIIYIFLTKTVLAFILELPYDKFIIGSVNWQALYINIAFHPLLMALIALSIKVPGSKNTKMISDEVKKIVYGEERKLIYKPRKLMKAGSFIYFFFNFIYLVMFSISFGVIIWLLNKLGFQLVSGALFIFFLTLVSFLGFRLRTVANQYLVLPRKENLFNFLVDFFTLPIVRVGKFFSTNFSKINIFIYILDFAIETPLKMLIELLEKALSFIGEKREEIS